MKSETILISPSLAAKWLQPDTNRENRHIRQSHVASLAKQIRDGKWQVTHQGIAFAKDGRLLDGQHRLAAIVLAGQSVRMLVSSDLDPEAFQVMDCGTARAHYDRIHLVDNQNENKLICTAISSFLRSTRKEVGAIPVSAIEDEFLDKSESWMWVASEFSAKPQGLTNSSVIAALAIYRHHHPEKAEHFAREYKTGAQLALGSASLALRNAILAKGNDITYWHAAWAMRVHLTTKNTGHAQLRIIPATEDMDGNRSIKLIQQRTARGVKAGITRRQQKVG